MLRRTLGETIKIEANQSAGLWAADVDPTQVESALLNLAVNARDAMPDGGKLTILTDNVNLGRDYAQQHPDVSVGEYVMLVVSDSGIGMTEEVKNRLFEPFFTTKEQGKGTGLGLATCYGIVKQNGGDISVHSEARQGTTISVYLPRTKEEIGSATTGDQTINSMPGNETVLLVEDEPLVRGLACRVLREHGYNVLEASNGVEALEIARKHSGKDIPLLLTDVIMPQMGGKELAVQLKAIHPETRVLYTSGYTDDHIVNHGALELDVHFLAKPFSPASLLNRVREVLNTQAMSL